MRCYSLKHTWTHVITVKRKPFAMHAVSSKALNVEHVFAPPYCSFIGGRRRISNHGAKQQHAERHDLATGWGAIDAP